MKRKILKLVVFLAVIILPVSGCGKKNAANNEYVTVMEPTTEEQNTEKAIEGDSEAVQRMSFINEIAPIAKNMYEDYGILPSITIAIAAGESDFGNSSIAIDACNLYGMRWTETSDAGYLWVTQELEDGTTERIQYCSYNCYADSIEDWCKMIFYSNRFMDIPWMTNSMDVCNALYYDGYSTNVDWVKKVASIINNYDLIKYDPVESENQPANKSLNMDGTYGYVESNAEQPETEGLENSTENPEGGTVFNE